MSHEVQSPTYMPRNTYLRDTCSKPTRRSLLQRLCLAFIWMYQGLISPLFVACCRFSPRCSDYAQQAILRHGVFKGIWLSMMRIWRCNPWGGHGHDPVP